MWSDVSHRVPNAVPRANVRQLQAPKSSEAVCRLHYFSSIGWIDVEAVSNLEQQVRILLLTKLFLNFIPEGTDDAGPTLGCVNPPRTVRDPAIDIMAGATFERHLLNLRPGPPISGRRGGKVNSKVFIRV